MNLLLSISSLILLTIISFNPTSAHFFPNVSSIPSTLIPNKTLWESFNNFTGCHKGIKKEGLHKLKKYFQYFGYLNNSYDDFTDEFDPNFESAVKTYQLNFNLNTTGEIDESTLRHLVQPRCGNPDIVNGTSTMYSGRRLYGTNSTTVARYAFFPDRPRWSRDRRQLSYAFLPENQLSDAVRGVFSSAFQRWSTVTTLRFSETTSYDSADIRIGFYRGDHGDGEPFDGVLGTLAHAFAPPVGRFHLDGDENWVTDGDFSNASPFSAVDLESVAVHEIGHLLGMGHTSVEEAIMYPTIVSGVRKVELASDDIMGIQELYGSNSNFNGSGPTLNRSPSGQRDRSGAHLVGFSSLLVFGVFLILLLLFV